MMTKFIATKSSDFGNVRMIANGRPVSSSRRQDLKDARGDQHRHVDGQAAEHRCQREKLPTATQIRVRAKSISNPAADRDANSQAQD